MEILLTLQILSYGGNFILLMARVDRRDKPPAQAPPQRGLCPGGKSLWLGENVPPIGCN